MPYLGNYTGAPSTNPSTEKQPFLRDSATPNAFGVNVDEANQQLGRSISGLGSEIGSIANNFQDDYNTAAATDLQNQYNMATVQRTAEHNQLTGKAALDDQPAYQQFLTDTREKLLGSAPNGAVARIAGQRLANINTALSMDSTRHVIAETYRYKQDQLSSNIQLSQDQAAQDPDNVEKLQANVANIKNSVAEKMKGSPDEAIQIEQKKQVAVAMNSRFTTLTQQGRADQAMKEYEAIRNDIVDPGDRIHDSIYDAQIGQGADRFARRVASGAGTVDGAFNAIYGQESGYGKNNKTSIDDAHGPMQILRATFNRYAQEGEKLDNPDDNRAVGRRIIEDYYQKYNGDLSRVAVAYFSGEGNVNTTGTTPWKNDYKDGNGKSVSSYVADVVARSQDTATQLAQPTTITKAVDQARIFAAQQFPQDPTAPSRFEQAVRSQYSKTRQDNDAIKSESLKDLHDIMYAKNATDPDATPSTWSELITNPDFVKRLDTIRNQPGGELEVAKLRNEAYKNSLNVPPSDERDARFDNLMGMANDDPQRFRKEDLASYDLTVQQRSQLHSKQRELTSISQRPPDLAHAQNVLVREDFFNTAHLTPSKIGAQNVQYDAFMGQFNKQVALWTQQGKKPTDDEIKSTAAMLLTKMPGTGLFRNQPFYQVPVPQAATDAIVQQYRAEHNGAYPDRDTVRGIFNMRMFNRAKNNPEVNKQLFEQQLQKASAPADDGDTGTTFGGY